LGTLQIKITNYDKALALDPRFVLALTNKGLALDLGNDTGAIIYYDKALDEAKWLLTVNDDNGKLVDERYDKRGVRFLYEFEWYIEALKNQRKNGTPY
jgi:tetratricopeptide (TPR) repeat protein